MSPAPGPQLGSRAAPHERRLVGLWPELPVTWEMPGLGGAS